MQFHPSQFNIIPKVQRHFHLGPWFLICAFRPLIDHQTFNLAMIWSISVSTITCLFQFDHWF
jgi:hypothetical protein